MYSREERHSHGWTVIPFVLLVLLAVPGPAAASPAKVTAKDGTVTVSNRYTVIRR